METVDFPWCGDIIIIPGLGDRKVRGNPQGAGSKGYGAMSFMAGYGFGTHGIRKIWFQKGGMITMRSRRFAAAMAAGLLGAALMAFPAQAHGHHRQVYTETTDTSCPVCTLEDCTESGRHSHDGHNYCGYDHSSGYCDGTCANVSDSGTYCHSRRGCCH